MMDNKGGIPKTSFITTPSGKVITPLSKACYLHVSSGQPVENMILGVGKTGTGQPDMMRTPEVVESEFNAAIFGAAVTEATRVLGNAIMDGLETEGGIMGDMSGHEGIVLKDKKYAGGGFVKITGEFIVSGATGGGFGEKPITIGEGEADEEEDLELPTNPETDVENTDEVPLDTEDEFSDDNVAHKRRIVLYPGKFKPPHRGHLGLVEALSQHLVRPQDRVLVLISPLSVHTDGKIEISAKDSKKVWNAFLESAGLQDKVQVLISPINSPVKAAYALLDNEIDGFETMPGDFCIPGASTKIDERSGKPDYERFARFDQYTPSVEGLTLGNAEEWAVEPFVDDSGTEFSATNFREAIDANYGLEDFLPEGVSVELFHNLIGSDQQVQESSFQDKMKKKLSIIIFIFFFFEVLKLYQLKKLIDKFNKIRKVNKYLNSLFTNSTFIKIK